MACGGSGLLGKVNLSNCNHFKFNKIEKNSFRYANCLYLPVGGGGRRVSRRVEAAGRRRSHVGAVVAGVVHGGGGRGGTLELRREKINAHKIRASDGFGPGSSPKARYGPSLTSL